MLAFSTKYILDSTAFFWLGIMLAALEESVAHVGSVGSFVIYR